MTKAEKARLDVLHGFSCIACGAFPVVVHHMVNQQHRKRDHARTIPLCPDCHVGPFSIHGSRKSFRAKYGSEEDMLERVNKMLGV